MSATDLAGIRYAEYCQLRRRGRVPKAAGDCHLCGGQSYGSGGRHHQVVVDHCHACDVIRGVLCVQCNARIRSCDLAVTNFADLEGGWPGWRAARPAGLRVRRTLADVVQWHIRRVHETLSQYGAAAVFAYQNGCACAAPPRACPDQPLPHNRDRRPPGYPGSRPSGTTWPPWWLRSTDTSAPAYVAGGS